MTTEKSYVGWYFLLGVIMAYGLTSLVSPENASTAIRYFATILRKLIPVLIFIFVLMTLTNYLIKPKALVKYLGKNSGIRGWLIAIASGVLSSGPIYMWYPFLGELQKKGMKTGLIAAFLYNRAIKIPLFPLLITYFGISYSIILMIVMMILSVLQGLATEKIIEVIE